MAANATARLLLNNINRFYDLFLSLTSDLASQFIFRVQKNLRKIFGIEANLSTAFYSETDGQNDIANQKMK